MRKKLFIGLFVIIGLILITGRGFAGTWYDYGDIYMTSANGNYDHRTTYSLNETPWLYLGGDWMTLWTDVNIDYSGSQDTYYQRTYHDSVTELWIPIDQWDSIKANGTWTLTPTTYIANFTYYSGNTQFTVVPEPISSILFVSGGTLLAGRRYIKRKKKA